ncbi:MAG: alpha/beta hydrolase [Pseudomonadota bacterium]
MAYEIAELPMGVTNYELGGQGPLVVLVHGISTPSMAYDYIQPLLWNEGFSTLRYDLYGRGGSEAKPSFRYDIAFYTQQLHDLLAHLSIGGPQHFVGYSMGGGIIACFADTYPNLIKSLTFVASSGFLTGAGDVLPLFKTKTIGPFLFEHFGAAALRRAVIKDGKENNVAPEFYLRQAEATRKPGYMQAITKSAQVGPLVELEETHKRIALYAFPTLAIWAVDDRVIKIDSKARFDAVSHPDVISEVVAGAGHAIAYTHHDSITPRIAQFLKTET